MRYRSCLRICGVFQVRGLTRILSSKTPHCESPFRALHPKHATSNLITAKSALNMADKCSMADTTLDDGYIRMMFLIHSSVLAGVQEVHSEFHSFALFIVHVILLLRTFSRSPRAPCIYLFFLTQCKHLTNRNLSYILKEIFHRAIFLGALLRPVLAMMAV